ncbi:MAG: helix-turn-helix domain-containing protein [Desulfobacterium sp.]|nr:helix-turn-helix domain-containing protein [Desulfobacterium sp.]MBU3947603.1 helix-turn-helix domain-containing protein [Pseudomonadota bacterium]MBU4010634.1 helix-turn-helix domain-containing protein [Pseudomonadota bacterium]MBU4036364.1 helix-turn-helix domain-containing protein [Pseudomonadota bacterium]
MLTDKPLVSSGVNQLDQLLGGLRIGDNVVWYDNAGSLAPVFYLNFIKASQSEKKSIIYINFDHSIKTLMERLGTLADYDLLTILDCFTFGKGDGAEVFLKFYEEDESNRACKIITIDEPRNADHVTGAFYGLHKTMRGDVRFIFDSLTGMQELWGGEEQIQKFYSHSCPRLYELNTVAYWVVEKEAHSLRLKANINKIAQVAIDLSLKRGKTFLSVIKAEKRNIEILNEPFCYWNKGLDINIDFEKRTQTQLDLGTRLKEIRSRRGLSQTELAKLVGVTSSTISQIESNQIYPSLPALIKIAESLSVKVSTFFGELDTTSERVVFSFSNAANLQFSNLTKGVINGKALMPVESDSKAKVYLINVPPKTSIASHFFIYKGEEVGYLLTGRLQFKLKNKLHTAKEGDLIYLTTEVPTQWKNPDTETARLLWINIK